MSNSTRKITFDVLKCFEAIKKGLVLYLHSIYFYAAFLLVSLTKSFFFFVKCGTLISVTYLRTAKHL